MFKDRLIDFYYDTRDFIGRHKKVVMPVFLLIEGAGTGERCCSDD